ncbi:transcription elongation factor B polypeptide 3 isoform X1 [Hibiscus syriacus]|uniref:transcription elongation factor B polypeptide 3 isoform X1 n=1 Tax=Hibiscus syriacus TaxID=106335 RepID=UPI001920F851|nr:transcription elongation factor B polypeptide 3 isoform X1 [Hibiscus syriacus]XP_039011314.1 transcription elongation factor B polypeptide 3 isoform X1 [Hibiscus syriacus]
MYPEKKPRSIADIVNMRHSPSLVDLCVRTAIDNVRYLGDVGETDTHLLERILPHCTIDQLLHVETSTKGRDLSPVTDKLWKNFYELQFGRDSMKVVIERMKRKKVSFRWRQLYEAKLKDVQEAENKAIDRLRQLYKKEDARKQSRQVQLCTKVPPSSKRSFFSGSGPGCSFSNKSNIMKKAKIDFMKSQEVKNLAAIKKKAVQSHHSGSAVTKSSGFCGKNSASISKHAKPLERRF